MASTTIHYLEMNDPGDLIAGREVAELDVTVAAPPNPSLNRRFYRDVGRDWAWTDRLGWSDAEWCAHVVRDALITGVGWVDGAEVGYFELEAQVAGDVQIQYFGLLPQWIGRGLGAAFLTEAIRQAWAVPGARRVWVHTCTDDHEHALANYERRGFREYRSEQA